MKRPRPLHHWILQILPHRFRSEYGEELLGFWDAQSREARYRGFRGRMRFRLHLLWDVVRTGLRLRLRTRLAGGPARRPDGGSPFGSLGADIRIAIRSLRRSPLFTTVSVVTLGLGIAATTALFTVVDSVLLRPLPFPDSEQLVVIQRGSATGDVGWLDFRDWREQAVGFDGMAAYVEDSRPFQWDDVTENLSGARVARDYFDVMGSRPALGRTFSPTEDQLDGPLAMVISHHLWQTRFAGDPDVIGRSVTAADRPVPIVGVMPEGFAAPTRDTDFWVPLQEDGLLAEVGLPTGTRSLSFLDVVARLATPDGDGVAAELASLAKRIDQEFDREDAEPVVVRSLQESITGEVHSTLWFLMGAVVLVLLVACANVAGLSFSRTTVRARDFAVRSALGASRARLFRLVVVEWLVLALLAASVGASAAVGLVRSVVALAPPELPRVGEIEITLTGLTLALIFTTCSALFFGLGPAAAASRRRLADTIAAGGRGSSGSARTLRPQRILVTGQVALSVTLLCGAALLANSFARLLTVERGFDTEGILVAGIGPSEARYGSPEEIDAFYEELLARVRAIPGVESATTTYSPPLEGNEFNTRIRLEDEVEEEEGHWAGTVIVRDDFFATTGTPLLRGRPFGPDDRLGSPLVAIVNESMAEALWPGEDPIGQRFHFHGGLRGSADSFLPAFFPREAYTVVGVAGDVRRTSLGERPIPEYYRPHRQITWGFQYLLVRGAIDLGALANSIRDAVRAQDPTIPTPEIRTLDDRVSASLATPRFRTLLLVTFAGLTCLLAMVGLYAVMAMAVSRRTREIGVRLALGATPRQLLGTVLAGGARLVALGVLLGLVGASLGTRWIASMLFEVRPTDPLTYAAVCVVTGAVALAACYGPARRAARVDPVVSLQAEA